MKTAIKHHSEWKMLRESLVVHGDFVLNDPLITDEIIKETEDEMARNNVFDMKEFPVDWIETLFYRKVDERIIYEEPVPEEEPVEEVFIDESKDAIIKKVVAKMITDIRKRRNYEY